MVIRNEVLTVEQRSGVGSAPGGVNTADNKILYVSGRKASLIFRYN